MAQTHNPQTILPQMDGSDSTRKALSQTQPTWALPPLACDAHMHIFGPYDRFPLARDAVRQPAAASVESYLSMAAAVGLSRRVVVQPSFYGLDNTCTLDMVSQSGGHARAVVVVKATVTEAELFELHQRGARGVRLQSVVPGGVSLDSMEEIASRVQGFGWHLQLFADDSVLPALHERLRALPVPIVVDHMAHLCETADADTPGMRVLLDLMEAGKAWVKLSNAFFPPDAQRARRLIAANRERVLWGSDWPHVGYRHALPETAALLEQLAQWSGDQATWERILATNPDHLYFSQA